VGFVGFGFLFFVHNHSRRCRIYNLFNLPYNNIFFVIEIKLINKIETVLNKI